MPHEPRDFLEVTMLAQLLHRITGIDKRVDLRHHFRDARRVHHDPVEAAMNCFSFVAHIFMLQLKAPSTNIQAPEKFQAPSSKPSDVRFLLDVEVWSFSGCWCLVLGCFIYYRLLQFEVRSEEHT